MYNFLMTYEFVTSLRNQRKLYSTFESFMVMCYLCRIKNCYVANGICLPNNGDANRWCVLENNARKEVPSIYIVFFLFVSVFFENTRMILNWIDLVWNCVQDTHTDPIGWEICTIRLEYRNKRENSNRQNSIICRVNECMNERISEKQRRNEENILNRLFPMQ